MAVAPDDDARRTLAELEAKLRELERELLRGHEPEPAPADPFAAAEEPAAQEPPPPPWEPAEPAPEAPATVTAGAGIRYHRLGLDYAFLDHRDLDASHRVSGSYRF